MIEAKYLNPIKNFQSSGVKTVGDYTYVLLISLDGQVLIERVKSDNSEIKFAKKPSATSIETFWEDPTVHTYDWINKI